MSDTTNNIVTNVAAKDLSKVDAASKATVEAENVKSTGDVLVTVEADRVEHGGVGYTKGKNFWMPSDAAQFHAAQGTVKRIQ